MVFFLFVFRNFQIYGREPLSLGVQQRVVETSIAIDLCTGTEYVWVRKREIHWLVP